MLLHQETTAEGQKSSSKELDADTARDAESKAERVGSEGSSRKREAPARRGATRSPKEKSRA